MFRMPKPCIPIRLLKFKSCRRSYSSIGKMDEFLQVEESGDKAQDLLNRLVYAPLVKNRGVGQSAHVKRPDRSLNRTKFYSYFWNKFPVVFVLESLVHNKPYGWTMFEREVGQLNELKNYEILDLKPNERKFIDPNEMLRLYDVAELKDVQSLNIAMNCSKETVSSLKTVPSVKRGDVRLKFDGNGYKLFGSSETAMYLDSSKMFEVLDNYKDIYKVKMIKIDRASLDYMVLQSSKKSSSSALSYEKLLTYAKENSSEAQQQRQELKRHDLQSDEHYLDFFIRIAEMGFVHTRQQSNFIYLSRDEQINE